MRFAPVLRPALLGTFLFLHLPGAQAQQKNPATPQSRATPAPTRSASIANVRYDLTFDSTTGSRRSIEVAMSFDVTGPGAVLLSLPSWTPGAYEISNFARWVVGFTPTGGDSALTWDKLDYDTWRVQPGRSKAVTVRFDYMADSLDNAMAWSRPDFAFFNGTNLFFYPEGRGFNFPAAVTLKTQDGWHITTSMRPGQAPGSFAVSNYHDLVDTPVFIGRFDVDSMQVSGRMTRLATYPVGILTGAPRQRLWDDIGKMIPAESAVFQETPWDTYSNLLIFDPSYGGGSALEHSSSHVGIYNPQFIGTPLLSSITAHEIFHAWNVKRLRPAEMVPYRYDQAQPTPWLWVSEGITDYYADLALSRGGIIDSTQFLTITAGKVTTVADAPPTALEDASLSTWIHPVDGSGYIYYPKGSLAGFLIDILIREGSDNARSLDDVMRQLYQGTYKKTRGFNGTDWWTAVSKAAGGRSFADFNKRYIDGREAFPFDSILPLAGLRMTMDTVRDPRLGISTNSDSSGIVVNAVVAGGPAEAAGVRPGDHLLAIGDLSVTNPDFGPQFRTRYSKREGAPLPIKVRRGTDTLTLNGKVVLAERAERRIQMDPNASEKAVRIRNGIMKGK
ncbi:MAG TPA: PDZ domain-containing protein [Gemmatimonadales bacterium]|nr:PDZ domain-containing protein [Gemmatimonadales bacterium]